MDFLMSFLTDVFECFPPGRGILNRLSFEINTLRQKSLLPPSYLTDPYMILYGPCGHLIGVPATAPELCESHLESIPATITDVDGLRPARGLQLSTGLTEFARICIRAGVDIYVSDTGYFSVLDAFCRVGFGQVWRSLVKEEAGIEEEYIKKSIDIRQACCRRTRERRLREEENVKRREEIQKWREQDRERENTDRRRMEEESQWFQFPPSSAIASAATTTTLTPWLALEEYEPWMAEARKRWATEDHQREVENEERKEARLRWAKEDARRVEEDRRRKEEEKSWNFVVGNRDRLCECL